MKDQSMTLEESCLTGIDILSDHLGPVGRVRFFQQSETGWGNYSEERYKLLGNPDLKTLVKKIQVKKAADNVRNIVNHST